MSKVKTGFFCSNCGYESAKWVGKCPSCDQWNTFQEEIIHKEKSTQDNGWKNYHETKRDLRIIALREISSNEQPRIISADPELNRVLGGGIVPGSIVLI